MNRYTTPVILLSLLFASCDGDKQQQQEETVATEINPAAEGFNSEASDEKAIALADSVMKAMGGRKAYDDLRYISWNFFGVRDLIWDKHTGRVRIDVPSKNTTYLVNVHSMEGKAFVDSAEITNPDSLKVYLQKAKSIWINDSYWLVMPFKLKDTGVTLNYSRVDTTMSGTVADVVALTFEGVGDTPDNKYEVYIDQADHLVKQWAYFEDAAQAEPSAVWPWDNYTSYKGVLLSADRSDAKGPRNVKVYNELPDEVFTSFNRPELK